MAAESQVTHLHKKYREDLLSYYQLRGYDAKVMGLIDKPGQCRSAPRARQRPRF